jgi:hypothetical protein
MKGSERYKIVLKLGAEVFTNLGTAYLVAISISPNLWTLTNNVVFCILCLYTAYKFQQFLENE